jgi:hypothetical protein
MTLVKLLVLMKFIMPESLEKMPKSKSILVNELISYEDLFKFLVILLLLLL